MIPVGEKLGGRYFVIKAQDREEPGLVFEVRDALSNVFHAQLLYKTPLQGTDLDVLRRELASLGKTPLLVTPDEIVATSQGVPCAIFKQPLPPPLADDLTPMVGMGSPEKKLQQQRALLGSFAALADELGRAAGSRTGHGAISLAHVGAEGKGDARKCVLSGFGIEAAARLAEKKPRPAPKADPAGLFLTLHDALDKVSAVPEGSVAARWSVLRNCAKAGDHPALASCGALAKFLRVALTELEQNPVKAAPPPPAAKETPAGADQSKKTAAQRESKPAPKPAQGLDQVREWVKKNDRTAKIGGGALGAVVLGAVLYVSFSEDEGIVPSPPADTTATASTGGADGGARGTRGVCGRESVTAPVTIELVGAPDHVDAVCAKERQTLHVFGRSAGSWVTGERGVRRGSQYDHGPTTLTETLREPGVAFANATAAWTVWRASPSSSTPTPSAFTVTRLDDVPQPLTLQTAGLDPMPFRGAWLLKVDDQGVWIASTLARPEGPTAVVIRLAQSAARVEPPLTVYRLADASVESAIASDPPVLLLRTSEGTRHSFTTAQVPLTSLAVISSSATTSADGGASGDAGATLPMREVPAVALQRSEAWQVEGAAAVAASEGYGAATTDRHFVVTMAEATNEPQCSGVWCLAEGSVSLVTWPARGGPVARSLSQHGRGESVAQGANSAVVALVAEENGARQVAHTLASGGDGGGAVTTETVNLRGVRRAKVVFCGTEPWVVYGAMTPEARLGALPLACVSRR
jgi:hypothetical protein